MRRLLSQIEEEERKSREEIKRQSDGLLDARMSKVRGPETRGRECQAGRLAIQARTV